MEYIEVPVGIGVLVMALLQLLKKVGVVKDGTAGKWALGANIVAVSVLTFAVQVFSLDLGTDLSQSITEIAGLVGQLILAFLSSVGSYKLLGTAEVYQSK